MKIRHLIWAGAAAYVSYQLVSRRRELAQEFRDGQASLERFQRDWQNVQHQLTRVGQQLPVLDTVLDDLAYKVRVFQKETEVRLNQIPLLQPETDGTDAPE